jgi:tetratricopeptide (TPR) repeat protein
VTSLRILKVASLGRAAPSRGRSEAVNAPHHPNRALRALITEAGWTGRELAQAVNALGGEAGLALHYDRTSVAHWLSGARPRPPVPDLICEAFSRRLGRRLSQADIGLGLPQSAARPGNGQRDPAAELSRLFTLQAQADAGRRPGLTACTYRVAALEAPAWAPGSRTPAARAPAAGPAVVNAETVRVIESVAQVFSAHDAAYGGGGTRRALAGYLAHDVAPRIRAAARPAVGPRLYSAAAQLAYLCGFMCFDDELHGLALHYYLAALRLATEAGDESTYAITQRAMSVQARLLHHDRQAVHLAEAAATAKTVTPVRQAFLYGQLAVAHAAAGDRISALTWLTAAERHLDRATSAETALIGAYHPASLAHQQAAVLALLGDRKGAIGALTLSLRYRPATERRSRAITTARLAELQLREGYLDEATHTWSGFLDDYPYLRSARARTALNIMRSMLHPHAGRPATRALLTRAVDL